MPAAGFTAAPLIALTAVAAGFIALGAAGFRHRDAGY
jgi:putative exporter of polyketide antibiotics